jgi:hypothetical protein
MKICPTNKDGVLFKKNMCKAEGAEKTLVALLMVVANNLSVF